MSLYFEIIIFTAAAKDYADFILDIIETRAKLFIKSKLKSEEEKTKIQENYKPLISHRLYRHNCHLDDGVYVKDLSLLGRDLNKTIIVDNIKDNFERQPDNGIEILTWIGEENDRELQKLGVFLKSLSKNGVSDV